MIKNTMSNQPEGLSLESLQSIWDNYVLEELYGENKEKQFLQAWKKGVKLAGREFFVIQSRNISSATSKWDLTPNFEVIEQTLGGYNHGKQVLVALMYSFYDAIEGQRFLQRAGTPNIVDAVNCLDTNDKHLVIEMLLTYSGW